jgi:predicted nucleotidyltransferase component of viral defense system
VNLFDRLVAEAVSGQEYLAPLQGVVEKELLHHDILREMSTAGLLKELTFIGGTCLRACYGSNRLSEDLDFTGGLHFTRDDLNDLASVLKQRLRIKYDLVVEVSEPLKETGNVDTWKLKVTTRPEQPNLPWQRIHIDVCAVPSYDRHPMMLRNHYGVDMGTSGLIIQAQSMEEILADKLVAFELRSNRIKNRDVWDIGWLKQQNVTLPLNLIWLKIADRHWTPKDFRAALTQRVQLLREDAGTYRDFIRELERFLPPRVVSETVKKDGFWAYLTGLVAREASVILNEDDAQGRGNVFTM